MHWNKAIVMLSPEALLQHSAVELSSCIEALQGKDLTAKNTFTFYREQHHLLLHSSSVMEEQASLHFLSG